MLQFWGPVERLERSNLEQLQTARLVNLLRYLEDRSPYYRRRFREHGIDVRDFRGLDDLRGLPVTSKGDLIADIDTEAVSFYHSMFLGEPRNILRWHRTSGTSGIPVRVADTRADWHAYAEQSAEALYAMGVCRDDTAVVPFGHGPFIAFWSYISGLERIGAALVPSGGLSTISRVELLKEFKASVLIATPSYVAHLGATAIDMGLDPSEDLSVRLIITTGEPLTDFLRQRVQDLWGVQPRDRVGGAEVGGIAYECPICTDTYHFQDNWVIAEVLDPDTGAPVGPGEEGELLVTSLLRRGMPVLRFRTGNIVRKALDLERVCGRALSSMARTENGAVIRRTDALFKVKGVLVDPVTVEKTIREAPACNGEFQVILTNDHDQDEVTVRAEADPRLVDGGFAALKTHLEQALRGAMGISAKVEVLNCGDGDSDGNKAKRVVDLRRKGASGE